MARKVTVTLALLSQNISQIFNQYEPVSGAHQNGQAPRQTGQPGDDRSFGIYLCHQADSAPTHTSPAQSPAVCSWGSRCCPSQHHEHYRSRRDGYRRTMLYLLPGRRVDKGVRGFVHHLEIRMKSTEMQRPPRVPSCSTIHWHIWCNS